MAGDFIWQPTPNWLEESNIARFLRRAGVASLAELQQRAAVDPAWFWRQVEQDLGITWY